jgi:hypothetical protein
MTAESQLKRFMAKFDSQSQALLRSARRALRARLPTANELVYDNYNFFVIGYSPTDRPSDAIVSLTGGSSGVGLCFIRGATLRDPKKVLLGSGNQTRFIRLPTVDVLALPEVEALIAEAIATARAPLPERGRGKLVIRSVSARQRPRRPPVRKRQDLQVVTNMHPRTQEILTCLDTELAGLRTAVDSVAPARRGERPAPDRWSVAEVLEHLAMVENAVLKACARQLDAARAAGLPAESETTPILPSLPPERVADRERAWTAPDRLVPKGIDADAAWREIEGARARLIDFVHASDGLALGQVSFPHPILGALNVYQWLLFAAGHHARHAAQIREIARQFA